MKHDGVHMAESLFQMEFILSELTKKVEKTPNECIWKVLLPCNSATRQTVPKLARVKLFIGITFSQATGFIKQYNEI